MHCAASFLVKNNRHANVFVNLENPPIAVTIPPFKTSPPFTSPGTYSIRAARETLPFPPPEILVTFSPGESLEAKAINRPNLDVDIIAKFEKGDLIPSLSPG
jgi:hypothetical protein